MSHWRAYLRHGDIRGSPQVAALMRATLLGTSGIPAFRYAQCGLRAADQRFVRGLIHEAFDLGRRSDLELEHPSLSRRVGVHQSRLLHNALVHFAHLAADGGIDVGRRLDRFDHSGGAALPKLRAGLRQLDEDKIAELLLRIGGDAHRCDLALDAQPFVVFGEFQHGRSAHSWRLYLGCTKGSSLTSTGTRLPRTSANTRVPALAALLAT